MCAGSVPLPLFRSRSMRSLSAAVHSRLGGARVPASSGVALPASSVLSAAASTLGFATPSPPCDSRSSSGGTSSALSVASPISDAVALAEVASPSPPVAWAACTTCKWKENSTSVPLDPEKLTHTGIDSVMTRPAGSTFNGTLLFVGTPL